jgi:hypothetical protein
MRRKARVVVGFKVPTDVTVHEPELRGRSESSGGPSISAALFLR